MNIYQRIAAVQKDCPQVKKDTKVGSGGNSYMAVSHDGVLTLLRDSIMKHGIVVATSQKEKGISVDGETKSGTAKIRFEALYDVSFINVDKPEDRHTVAVEAHGEDYNDKGPGKAISYATKTAMLKTFLIVTGDNDEERLEQGAGSGYNRSTSNPASPNAPFYLISAAQGKRLFAICKSSGTTIATVANKFGFEKAGEIKKADYQKICEFAEVGHKEEMVTEILGEGSDLPF